MYEFLFPEEYAIDIQGNLNRDGEWFERQFNELHDE
jgi:hypothetical protein